MHFRKLCDILSCSLRISLKQNFYVQLNNKIDPKYHTKILLGDFDEKLETQDLLRPTNGNENLREKKNHANCVRVVNIVAKNNVIDQTTMVPHQKIYKHTWWEDSQSHLLHLDRWEIALKCILCSMFIAADCNIEHYLLVISVRGRLSASKWDTRKYDVDKFILKKLNEPGVKNKCQFNISTNL